ncbi:hypothetical protein AHAS_Ahas03G0142900 [Arachis hypogaea]
MVREVSESCLDSLLTEVVSCYCNRFYPNKHDLAARRIEAIGYQVGHQLSERYTMERPRFNDHLEAIKFICKDFWLELFKKHVDNLRTNHRGTFVLQDNKFCWLARMSIDPLADSGKSPEDITSPTAGNKATHAMKMHLYFPCGILRGFLSNLGILCAVSADILTLPTCSLLLLCPLDPENETTIVHLPSVLKLDEFTVMLMMEMRAYNICKFLCIIWWSKDFYLPSFYYQILDLLYRKGS